MGVQMAYDAGVFGVSVNVVASVTAPAQTKRKRNGEIFQAAYGIGGGTLATFVAWLKQTNRHCGPMTLLAAWRR